MPQKNKKKMAITNAYIMMYMFFLLLEIIYIFLIWSSYGNPDGKFKNLYITVKNNINTYVAVGIIFLTISSLIIPGIGWLAFVLTLWRVAEMCCTKNERFGDSLNYGWLEYYQDSAKYFNEAEIERDPDGTRAAYSSAVGDTEDLYWLSKLSKNNKLYNDHMCDGRCDRCYIKNYGNIFEMMNTPRPLYTTSLLSKEMKSS
jgi:hypothetical protein